MEPDKIVELLEDVAEFLTPAAMKTWEIAMRQVGVDAVRYIFWGAISIMLAILLLLFAKKARKDTVEDGHYRDDDIFGFCFVATFAVVASAFFFSTAIGYIINPEWYAISKLGGFIR